MPYDLTNYLVIGVSSRALFDLSYENEMYEKEGLDVSIVQKAIKDLGIDPEKAYAPKH